MVWPLASLRRYGYDAVFFTFECGRRCETGEGVFSFKCQKADVLFHTLQAFINGRAYHFEESTLHDFSLPNASTRNIAQLNSLNLNGTLQTTTQGSSYTVNARPNSSLSPVGTNSVQSRSTDTLNGDYLEPNPRNGPTSRLSTNLRLSSLGSEGSPASPSSPNSYSNILEITNLNPLPVNKPHGNIYLEHPLQSHKAPRLSLELPQEQAPTISEYVENKKDHNMNVYMNAEIGVTMREDERSFIEQKPQRLATLAKMESLEIEPDSSSSESNYKPPPTAALYMNVTLGEVKTPTENCLPPVVTTPPVLTNNLNSTMNEIKKDYTKNVNGNIFGFQRQSSFTQDSSHCYQNLTLGNEKQPILTRGRYSRPEIFSKVDLPMLERYDRSEPCTPTQRQVNYIVLDLDHPTNNNNSVNYNNNNFNINNNGNETNDLSPVPQMVTSISMISGLTQQHPETPVKLGYATIDFDRSNALSNILSNTPINDNDQSCRRTRHDSNVTPVLALMREHSSFSD